MAVLRVILIAEDISACPIFSEGERITIEYPRVVLEETHRICLSVLDQCQPYLLSLSRGVAFATLGIGEEMGTLSCCCLAGGVTFNVIKQHRQSHVTPESFKHLTELKLDISQLRAMPVFAPLPEACLGKIIPLLQLRQVNNGTDIMLWRNVTHFGETHLSHN